MALTYLYTPLRGAQTPLRGVHMALTCLYNPLRGVQTPLRGVHIALTYLYTPLRGAQIPLRAVQIPLQGVQTPMLCMQKAWHQNELFIQAFNLPATENLAGLKNKPTTRLELGGLINRKKVALRISDSCAGLTLLSSTLVID